MYILAAENSWASVGHNNLQERKRERERFKRYLIEFVDGWKRLWTWEKLYIRHTHGFVWIMKTVCEWERFWVWRTFWVWLGEKFIHMCVNWERERERERSIYQYFPSWISTLMLNNNNTLLSGLSNTMERTEFRIENYLLLLIIKLSMNPSRQLLYLGPIT